MKQKFIPYLRELNAKTNLVYLSICSITLFYISLIFMDGLSYVSFFDSTPLGKFLISFVFIILLSTSILMLICSKRKYKVNFVDQLNYIFLEVSVINLVYLIMLSRSIIDIFFTSIYILLSLEMMIVRMQTYIKTPNEDKEYTQAKSLKDYAFEFCKQYSLVITLIMSFAILSIYHISLVTLGDKIFIISFIILALSILNVVLKNKDKINFRDLFNVCNLNSAFYLVFICIKFDKFNPSIIAAILIYITSLVYLILRVKQIKCNRIELESNCEYKSSFTKYINIVNLADSKIDLLAILSIISVISGAVFCSFLSQLNDSDFTNLFYLMYILLQIILYIYICSYNNYHLINFKDYVIIPVGASMIMSGATFLIFSNYVMGAIALILGLMYFGYLAYRINSVKFVVKVNEASAPEVIENTVEQAPEEIYLNEEIYVDEIEEEEEEIEQIDISKYLDVRDIDTYKYNEFYETYYDYLSRNSLKILNIEDEHQIRTLLSVFVNLEDIDELKSMMKPLISMIKKYETLGLLHYEIFAFNYLDKINPEIKLDILNNSKYFIVNSQDTYYNKLVKCSSNDYMIARSEFFDSFFLKYNNLQVVTILSQLYQEVANYLDMKVNKKIVKSNIGRCETSGYFDLYLLNLDYDFAKAKRQATKFLQEYDLAKDNQSQKVLKEFIDALHKSEYIDTIIPFLAQYAPNIASHRRLFFEICTKINLISITRSSHYLYDKFILVLTNIISNSEANEIYSITDEFFDSTSDLSLLYSFTKKVFESYGQTHKYSQYINNKLISKIKQIVEAKDNLFDYPKYNSSYIYIMLDYITKVPAIKSKIISSINASTVFKFIDSFTNKVKVDNAYNYELDQKAYSMFISKNDIIKFVKENEQTPKHKHAIELVKNRTYSTRSNIDFIKM